MFELIGIWAVIGFALVCVAGLFASELDSGLMAIATYLIAGLTVQYGLGISVWGAFVANPLLFFASLFAFGLVGALYAGVWKWPNFIRKNDKYIMESYNYWVKDEQDTAKQRGDNADVSFDAFLDSDDYHYNVWQHKERLAAWASVWVFSIVWELMHKPVKWAWNVLYTGFGNMFQNIGKNTARKLHDRK